MRQVSQAQQDLQHRSERIKQLEGEKTKVSLDTSQTLGKQAMLAGSLQQQVERLEQEKEELAREVSQARQDSQKLDETIQLERSQASTEVEEQARLVQGLRRLVCQLEQEKEDLAREASQTRQDLSDVLMRTSQSVLQESLRATGNIEIGLSRISSELTRLPLEDSRAPSAPKDALLDAFPSGPASAWSVSPADSTKVCSW